jgi:pilus assembly protein Flp/PilA
MKALLLKFRADQRGTTAIEYALIAVILSVGIIGTLSQIAPSIQANFQKAAEAFN